MLSTKWEGRIMSNQISLLQVLGGTVSKVQMQSYSSLGLNEPTTSSHAVQNIKRTTRKENYSPVIYMPNNQLIFILVFATVSILCQLYSLILRCECSISSLRSFAVAWMGHGSIMFIYWHSPIALLKQLWTNCMLISKKAASAQFPLGGQRRPITIEWLVINCC